MKRWILIGILSALVIMILTGYTGTMSDLYRARAESSVAAAQLNTTQGDLEATMNQLASVQLELNSTLDTLAQEQAKLATAQNDLVQVQDEVVSVKADLDDLKVKYDGLASSRGYTLKDPTYKELMSFLAADNTDKHTYDEDDYNCQNFSADLNNRAEDKGIRSAVVLITYPDSGHAIVAFDTVDRGLIYIEPQSDELVNLKVGKRFYQCIVPNGDYYYERPPFDDTIRNFVVIW